MTEYHVTVYPDVAFDNAIEVGVLSETEDHPKYAGNFMYMHSEHRDGHALDFFKNIVTRSYISVQRKEV